MTATAITSDPWIVVPLGAPATGSWTQTSGTPTVTITSNQITTPATRAGSTLLFTDGSSNTVTVTVQPNTLSALGDDGTVRQIRARLL